MTTADPRPFIVLSVLLDASARPAAITRCHGDAMERAIRATKGQAIAGLDLVELQIAAPVFHALRKPLAIPEQDVGIYDLFPIAAHLKPDVRHLAGQFLAADALWTLEEQGLLSGVPVNIKLNVPNGWSKEPKAIHQGLIDAGALALSDQGIETYKQIKQTWNG